MNRFLLAGLCAAAAGWAGTSSADAQCLKGPYGCGAICVHMFPYMHQHGPLYNYGDGCGSGGCGYGGCGHGGWGDPGHGHGWGPWSHGCNSCGGGYGFHGGHGLGGCGTCGTGGWGGLGGFHGGSNACSSCGSSGWGGYARTTYVNVFARLHPTAHRCGQTCGVSCESSGRSYGGHGFAGGCSTCGHGGGWNLAGLWHHGGGCDSCGGHGLRGLFGHLGSGLGGYGGGAGGGFGLQTAPWYLYWPTPNNQFQVPGQNAAGWSGNHWVLPAPYGGYGQAVGVNPYFPSFGPGR